MGELPEKIRAFIAIYPIDEVVRRLEAAQAQLRVSVAADAVSWTKPEQIHLTLQFLGNVKRASVGRLEDILKQVASELRCFQLRAESIGCFPNNKYPKIIWAGLAGELELLYALKGKLDIALGELGYVPEERKFHAHLTLGRIGDLKSADARHLVQEISRFDATQFGEWEMREINFMQSILSPVGASHRILNSFPLEKV
jgi:2'-5' RNA ligase